MSEQMQTSETESTHGAVSTNIKKLRGKTRLPKLRLEHTLSGGKRHSIQIEGSLNSYTGDHTTYFVSFLGSAVRDIVGLRYYDWKKVPKELRLKLWERLQVYVHIYFFCSTQCRYMWTFH